MLQKAPWLQSLNLKKKKASQALVALVLSAQQGGVYFLVSHTTAISAFAYRNTYTQGQILLISGPKFLPIMFLNIVDVQNY